MIKVQVRNIEELKQFLKNLPHGTKVEGIKAGGMYLIGNDRHGLKHPAPYKYVSRKAAYGTTFFSDKQRRFVMAMIRAGVITPGQVNRTGATHNAWTFKATNRGYSAKLSNATRGAYYVQDDEGQARQPAMVGHRKVSEVIASNIQGAMNAINQAVQRVIKRMSKKA